LFARVERLLEVGLPAEYEDEEGDEKAHKGDGQSCRSYTSTEPSVFGKTIQVLNKLQSCNEDKQ
jgi:hypothetical protein